MKAYFSVASSIDPGWTKVRHASARAECVCGVWYGSFTFRIKELAMLQSSVNERDRARRR